jgi:hypothetical protein
MRIVGTSLAAACISSLLLSVVVAQAVTAPLPANVKKVEHVTPVWNTTLTRE